MPMWRFVDTVFEDNDGPKVVRQAKEKKYKGWQQLLNGCLKCRGKLSSKASTARRNKDRQDVAVRQKMGARLDLVKRPKHADHSKSIKLGGGECEKNYEYLTIYKWR